MGDPGGHLADRREPLLQPRIALQPPELGHVLEREQVPVPLAGEPDHRHHQPDVEQAPVAVAVLEVHAQAARLGQRGQLRADRRRQLQDLADVLAGGLTDRHTGNRGRGLVERQHAPLDVRRHQPAQEAVDDVLVVGAEVRHLVRRHGQPRIGGPKPFRQRPRQQRDGEEPEQVDPHRVLREAPGGQLESLYRHPVRDHVHVLRHDDGQVQHRTERRDLQRAASKADGAGGDDGQEIERRKVADDAAGQTDEPGDQQRIHAELQVREPRMPIDEPERREIRDAQRIRQPDQKEERINRKGAGAIELNQDRGAKQQRADDYAYGDEP